MLSSEANKIHKLIGEALEAMYIGKSSKKDGIEDDLLWCYHL